MQFSTKILNFLPITTIAAACFLGASSDTSAQTLLLQWKFDESETGTEDAADTGTGTAAPGTFFGADRVGTTPDDFSTGAMNSAFAASDNLKYTIAFDPDKLDALQQFTLCAWINVQEAPAGNRRILAKQNASAEGFSWNIANSAVGGTRTAANFGTRMFIGGPNGLAFDGTTTTSAITIDADNKWVFVAVSYDGTQSTDNCKYYIGDATTAPVNQGTSSINGGTPIANDAAFGVGYTDAAPFSNLCFPGWVDDARVYSGILDAAALDAIRLENVGSPGPTAVTITNTSRSGNTVTFSFVTQAGKTHTVQYKNALEDASWLPLTVVAGDGDTEVVTDNTAIPATRYYRVVTQ